MTSPPISGHPSQVSLATVIPLSAHRPEHAVSRAAEILDRKVGSGWEALPTAAGRPGLRVERLVRRAPCGVDPWDTPASVALARALQLATAARAALELLTDEVATLSEALGADLASLSFDELDSVASSVISLGSAPQASPAWGHRAAADGAALVLDLLGADLQAAAAAHQRLYETFTEYVWEIPAGLLVGGARRWRPVSRHRLRHQLRRASRTGAIRGSLADVARQIVEARVARARLAPVRSMLAHHLGHLDRGVLTEADSAKASLAAVRDLQRALALLYDDERMERLLLADAFRTPELQVPARSIRTTLAAWACDVAAAGGRGALAIDGDTLGDWCGDLERDAPALAAGLELLEPLRPDVTLQQAVDAFVLREHAATWAGSDDRSSSGADRTWGAS